MKAPWQMHVLESFGEVIRRLNLRSCIYDDMPKDTPTRSKQIGARHFSDPNKILDWWHLPDFAVAPPK